VAFDALSSAGFEEFTLYLLRTFGLELTDLEAVSQSLAELCIR
jgi:hypothetical protein